MRKRIILSLACGTLLLSAAITFIGGHSCDSLSDRLLSNVEALTQNENSECPGGTCNHQYANGATCATCCSTGQSAYCDEYGCWCL